MTNVSTQLCCTARCSVLPWNLFLFTAGIMMLKQVWVKYSTGDFFQSSYFRYNVDYTTIFHKFTVWFPSMCVPSCQVIYKLYLKFTTTGSSIDVSHSNLPPADCQQIQHAPFRSGIQKTARHPLQFAVCSSGVNIETFPVSIFSIFLYNFHKISI